MRWEKVVIRFLIFIAGTLHGLMAFVPLVKTPTTIGVGYPVFATVVIIVGKIRPRSRIKIYFAGTLLGASILLWLVHPELYGIIIAVLLFSALVLIATESPRR